MYPRNATNPEPIAIGPVVQVSDGAVQTSGVTVRVKPVGVAEADGGGTTAYSTDGVVLYTPTQAETNYTSFVLIAKKTGCIPASVTVVTSASNTTGYAGTDHGKIANATAVVNLSNTTIKNATDNASQSSVDTLASYVDTEIAAIKAKTDLIQAFPTNFSLLMISGAGAIGLVDELGPQALSANSLEADIASQVWNTLTTGTFTDQSFGDRLLISTNNTREVAVTGSNHVASVLHNAEPNSIPEDAFVTGSISARAIGTDAIDADALADGAITSGVFAADSITATALATSAGEEIADKVWDEAIAAHLASGSTGEALNNAGGSGNPWITDLSTGYTGTQAGNILNQVKAKTDLITTGTIQSSIPVTAQGQITGPLFIGDDYLSANGRAFQWTVALPSGFVIATSTCRFGMEHAEGATEGASFAVSGTVTDAGGGNVTLAFSVPKATTGGLKAGFYRWSVEIASAGGNEVTRVASDGKKLVEWREKQT